MPNTKDPELHLLAEKTPAENGASCRWCSATVAEWDKCARDWGEGGIHFSECCPACGESQRTASEVNREEWWTVARVLFVIAVVYVMYTLLKTTRLL